MLGSRRDSGFLTAGLTRDGEAQEIISVGDRIKFSFGTGGLSLIHRVSHSQDDSSRDYGFACPLDIGDIRFLWEGGGAGLHAQKPPRGATVTGTGDHTMVMTITEDDSSLRCGQWHPTGVGQVLGRFSHAITPGSRTTPRHRERKSGRGPMRQTVISTVVALWE